MKEKSNLWRRVMSTNYGEEGFGWSPTIQMALMG